MNTKFCSENRFEDLGVDGKIILEWILGKWGGNVWTGFIWFRTGNTAVNFRVP